MQDEAMYSNSDFFRYSPHESEDSIEEDEEDSEEEEVRSFLTNATTSTRCYTVTFKFQDDDESEGYISQKGHKGRVDRGGYTEMKEQIYQVRT